MEQTATVQSAMLDSTPGEGDTRGAGDFRMRRAVVSVALASLVAGLAWASRTPQRPPEPAAAALTPRRPAGPLYDPDPEHIWNRVDRQLRVRVAADGSTFGADSLDPLLWRETRHLLTEPSHATALALFDEFLDGNGETLVKDPLRRAIFQRDLWAVFDWAVSRHETHAEARRALATRLARMIRRVALTRAEVARLPDSYSATIAGARYPTAYDGAHRDRSFLPPGLFEAAGPWVSIHGDVPVAQHSDELSRSTFGVFLSIPGGRQPTLDYLRKLWHAPEPFVVDPVGSFGGARLTTLNPSLSGVPEGTQIALARRILLIDTTGEIRRTGLVESLQIRVFRKPEPCRTARCGENDQDFYEFVLDRAGLLANAASGLRAVDVGEAGFLTFSSHGIDPFEHRPSPIRLSATLEMCVACHHERGLASVRTARRLFKPYAIADAGGPPGDGMAEFWKTNRADWGYLQAVWQTAPR